MNSKAALIASYLVFAAGVLNFAVCMLEYSYFGGSALSGKVSNGKFFLHRKSPREDLRYVEVNQSVFRYRAWHERTMEPGMLVAIAGGWNAQRIRLKRRGA